MTGRNFNFFHVFYTKFNLNLLFFKIICFVIPMWAKNLINQSMSPKFSKIWRAYPWTKQECKGSYFMLFLFFILLFFTLFIDLVKLMKKGREGRTGYPVYNHNLENFYRCPLCFERPLTLVPLLKNVSWAIRLLWNWFSLVSVLFLYFFFRQNSHK